MSGFAPATGDTRREYRGPLVSGARCGIVGDSAALDTLRRAIEKDLYTYTLIPDARGDVLGLICRRGSIVGSVS